MTPKQFLTRLKTLVEELVWASTTNKIFSMVKIVPQVPIMQLSQFRSPACFIVDNGYNHDEEHPGLLYQKFTLALFVENLQNNMGEQVLLGDSRPVNESNHIGMYDLEEELITLLINTFKLETKIILNESGGVKTKVLTKNSPLIFRSWQGLVITSLY